MQVGTCSWRVISLWGSDCLLSRISRKIQASGLGLSLWLPHTGLRRERFIRARYSSQHAFLEVGRYFNLGSFLWAVNTPTYYHAGGHSGNPQEQCQVDSFPAEIFLICPHGTFIDMDILPLPLHSQHVSCAPRTFCLLYTPPPLTVVKASFKEKHNVQCNAFL